MWQAFGLVYVDALKAAVGSMHLSYGRRQLVLQKCSTCSTLDSCILRRTSFQKSVSKSMEVFLSDVMLGLTFLYIGTCLYQRSGIVAVDFHNGPIRFCRRYGFAWAAAKVCAFRCHSIFCVLRGKVFRHFTKDSNILKERDRLGDDTCRKFCTVYGPVSYMQLSYHPQGTVTIAHVSSGSMSAAADPGGGVLRALSGLERICAEAEVGNTRKI